ncbi:hypothetical protein CYMTET_8818 [Cymbomonas tetramitiformis]|uniref:Midasin n=1 Tax=Cymbomonas tetramitiformis TaxID=36881 RepID=A0AAE0GSQ4_9CHLO|nr:hypothetical protein CYMTET_8818 [Cymbomonas tetramitiformis]
MAEEAVDCLVGSLPAGPGRARVLEALAAALELPKDCALHYDTLHRPVVSISANQAEFGRAMLPVKPQGDVGALSGATAAVYARTGHALRLLERVAVSVQMVEPLLLVGETGTGKTALVQYLARQVGAELTVINMSNQSDSADLIGGFKPVDAAQLCTPLTNQFQSLFMRTFPSASNLAYIAQVAKFGERQQWRKVLAAIRKAHQQFEALVAATERPDAGNRSPAGSAGLAGGDVQLAGGKRGRGDGADSKSSKKSKKQKRDKGPKVSSAIKAEWAQLFKELASAEGSLGADTATGSSAAPPAFAFVEGALVRALREGRWLLLDEINLASAETLGRLAGLLEGAAGSLVLSERGDTAPVPRHTCFRIFGAMNPATDVGKRDLPAGLKHRFTEVYVGEPELREDLEVLTRSYLERSPSLARQEVVAEVVSFYLQAKVEARDKMLDSANQKPQFSLRTLARALEYASKALPVYGQARALYDGFAMAFLTLLDAPSAVIMEGLLKKHFLGGKALKAFLKPVPQPLSGQHVQMEHFWVETGMEAEAEEGARQFVLTPSVRGHLNTIARAVLMRRHPVLLQGPTSAGKTSLVEYLARETRHRFIRLNNHEHTDLQEYLGRYVTDERGQLVFQEGPLVQAVRHGWWVVLDELNLAPTDVLEALNRLLDDNRELFLPELQESIKPHPHFMLFATQNPPGAYAGRKVLSRAFRNRFSEIHVQDIPDGELAEILNKRCHVAPSHASKLVEVMRQLQMRRSGSRVFSGKDSYITPRDLFRWAERHGRATGQTAQDHYQMLAEDGYMLLAERLRTGEERQVVHQVLEKVLKVKVDVESIYQQWGEATWVEIQERQEVQEPSQATAEAEAAIHGLAWTPSLRRLCALVRRCLDNQENVLLVGETGCGKTSVCQVLALLRAQRLRILNCHQHTETADFLGGYRPTRERERREGAPPFTWEDGPLVKAMREGDLMLVDELNLAEDSVLERLNSVLEPHALLVLAEKGGAEVEEVYGVEGFRVLATMNPGGDFGKKELSPALRNRFTEIWVAASGDSTELRLVVERQLRAVPDVAPAAARLLVGFWQFLRTLQGGSYAKLTSMRDILGWAHFIAETTTAGAYSGGNGSRRGPRLELNAAYTHGAYLTLLDGLSLVAGLTPLAVQHAQAQCRRFLEGQLSPEESVLVAAAALEEPPAARPPQRCDDAQAHEGSTAAQPEAGGSKEMPATSWGSTPEGLYGAGAFFVQRGVAAQARGVPFQLEAPSTSRNAMRVMRALQVRRPILLEGSPGVGKSSLIAALAAAAGHSLVRINLSEQTDMMDLLGADLPAEGGCAGEFRWSDGPFLRALKEGAWVLLDELNLAPQAVLEGLNSCLDHRAELFVPELGEVFKCPPSFQVFAAQNPLVEGGGRKGLPKSFVNRFSRVHVEAMEPADLTFIAHSLHPALPRGLVRRMVHFNCELQDQVMVRRSFGSAGAPWEFNLRDVLRWCELVEASPLLPHQPSQMEAQAGEGDEGSAGLQALVLHMWRSVYLHRLRTPKDRAAIVALLGEHFRLPLQFNQEAEGSPGKGGDAAVRLAESWVQVGRAYVPRMPRGCVLTDTAAIRAGRRSVQLLPAQMGALEAMAHTVSRGWMTVLVGGSGTGKTTLVRELAHLTGAPLRECALTNATDTGDLLGSFEQAAVARQLGDIRERALAHAAALSRWLLAGAGGGGVTTDPEERKTKKQKKKKKRKQPEGEGSCGPAQDGEVAAGTPPLEQRVRTVQALSAACSAVQRSEEGSRAQLLAGLQGTASPAAQQAAMEALLGAAMAVVQAAVAAEAMLPSAPQVATRGDRAPPVTPAAAEALLEEVQKLAMSVKAAGSNSSQVGRFEFVDGPLLRALESGEWLLLENANLCSPAVLDRLNPLMEPGGSLLVSEAGMGNGAARIVRPHPGFRLFLTLDPLRGEVSRAMRNRGIEVFLLPSYQPPRHNLEPDVSAAPPEHNEGAAAGEGGEHLLDRLLKALQDIPPQFSLC